MAMPELRAAPANFARVISTLEGHSQLDDEARAALGALPLRVVNVRERADLISQDRVSQECCVLLSGVACRSKIMSGGQRQLLSLHFAGEVPDIQSLFIRRADCSLMALTPVWAGYIAQDVLRRTVDRLPSLAEAFWRATLIDGVICRAWVANLGRRSAYQRTAHLLCETYVRMLVAGVAEPGGFSLPLTQIELGDALGVSPVHMNRVLQQLRRDDLIQNRGHYFAIPDWQRLRQAADFDPSYLQFRDGVLPTFI